MDRRLLALGGAIVLTGQLPFASAVHEPPPTLAEIMEAGDPIYLFVNETGRAVASAHEFSTTTCDDRRVDFDSTVEWSWQAEGLLEATDDPYEHHGKLELRARAAGSAYGTLQTWHGCEKKYENPPGRPTECTFDGRYAGRSTGADARIKGDLLRITFDVTSFFGSEPNGPVCTIHGNPASWVTFTPNARYFTNGSADDESATDVVLELPVHSLELIVPTSSTMTLELAEAGDRCLAASGAGTEGGSCVATAVTRLRAIPVACEYLRQSFTEHLDQLRAIQPPPVGAPEAYILVWGEVTRDLVVSLLSEARHLALACDDTKTSGATDALVRALRMYRDALIALLKEGKITERATVEALRADRQLQLIGVEDDAWPPDLARALWGPAAARLEVSVHSPVALHVYDERGGHVGWNASTNASEATIADATYNGTPGAEQRISLPIGFYRVVVDELERGDYVLAIGPEGSTGGEAYHARSEPGRTTSLHYAFEPDANGTLALEGFTIYRGPTTERPAFYERAWGPASPDPDAPASPDARATSEGTPREHRGAPDAGGVGVIAGVILAVVAARRRC